MNLERYIDYVDCNGNVESVIVWDFEGSEVQLLFRNGRIKTLPWDKVEKCRATDLSSVNISRFLILDNIVKEERESGLDIEIALKAWGKIFQEDRKIGDTDWKEKLATVIRKRLEGTGYEVYVDTEGVYGESPDGEDIITSAVEVELIKKFKPNKEVENFMLKASLLKIDTLNSEEARVVLERAVSSEGHLKPTGIGELLYTSDVMYDHEDQVMHRIRSTNYYPDSKEGVQELLDEMKDCLVFKNKCD